MQERAPGSDRWSAEVTPGIEGRWTFTVEAWSDPVATWRRHAAIKIPAGIDTELMLAEGAELHERAAAEVPKSDGREAVLAAVDALRDAGRSAATRLAAALAPQVTEALARHPLRELLTVSRPMPLVVERRRALYGSWYELFPRSEGAAVTRTARPSAAPCAPPPTGCRRSPPWASTWSISRPSTPSAPPSARAPTTRSRPARTMSAPLGHRLTGRRP